MNRCVAIATISLISLFALPNASFARDIMKVAESTSGNSFYIDLDSIRRDYIGNISFMAYRQDARQDLDPLFIKGNCNFKTAEINGGNSQMFLTGSIGSKLLSMACAYSE